MQPQATAMINEVGLALATIADVPLAVLITAVGVLAMQSSTGLPRWLGWLSVAAAAAQLIA